MAALSRQWCRSKLARNFIRGPSSQVSSHVDVEPIFYRQLLSDVDVGPTSIPGLHRGFSSHVNWKYRGQRCSLPLDTRVPDVSVDAWVSPNALLSGDVVVQDKASIWYGVVLRGDLNRIKVGPWSSVGDRSVIHAATSSPAGVSAETDIGRFVTIGAYSTLRSCVVENEVIVGQRCIIMEGSIIEKHVILASGSVVPPGRRIPKGEVWAGNPARFVRFVTKDEIALIPKLAEGIMEIAQAHSAEFLPYSTAYLEVEKLFGPSKIAL